MACSTVEHSELINLKVRICCHVLNISKHELRLTVKQDVFRFRMLVENFASHIEHDLHANDVVKA